MKISNKKIAVWGVPMLCLALARGTCLAGDADSPQSADQKGRGYGVTATEGMPGKYNKASGIIGMEVRNQNNERLGTIKDVVFDLKTERVSYAVMSVPPKNFLGMNEKLLAVPLDALTISADEKSLILNADKAKVEAAAGFDSKNWPNVGNPTWGAEPFWQKSNEKPDMPPQKPDQKTTPMP